MATILLYFVALSFSFIAYYFSYIPHPNPCLRVPMGKSKRNQYLVCECVGLVQLRKEAGVDSMVRQVPKTMLQGLASEISFESFGELWICDEAERHANISERLGKYVHKNQPSRGA